jgi:hypothetical protein
VLAGRSLPWAPGHRRAHPVSMPFSGQSDAQQRRSVFVGPRMRSRPRPNFTFLSSLCVNIMEFAEGSSPRAGPVITARNDPGAAAMLSRGRDLCSVSERRFAMTHHILWIARQSLGGPVV